MKMSDAKIRERIRHLRTKLPPPPWSRVRPIIVGGLAQIADDRVVELRVAGFSPSGRTIVVATTADITFISR
jgi:hypothetical protein